MNINKIIKGFVNAKPRRPRRVGRYHSSELYGIVSGRKKPEDFFKEEVFTLQSCRNISEGQFREDFLTKMLDVNKVIYEPQVKKAMKFKSGFEIVTVADFTFTDKIFECKCPVEMPLAIKPWNLHQLEAQYRAFNKDVYIGYFQAGFKNAIFKYMPSQDFWNQILVSVNNFHNKVVEMEKEKSKNIN